MVLANEGWALLLESLSNNGQIVLEATGRSMLPAVQPGDRLTFGPVQPGDPHPGDILVYRLGDRLVAHRLVAFQTNGLLLLQGDARWFKDPPVKREDVLGVLLNVHRAGQDLRPTPRTPGFPWPAALEHWLVQAGSGGNPDLSALPALVGAILGFSPGPEGLFRPSSDWLQKACEARLAGVLAHAPPAWLDETTRRQCQAQAQANRARHLVFEQCLDTLGTHFKQAGIQAIVLKGTVHAGLLYPHPDMRPMVDLDLLIQPRDGDAVGVILTGLGFAHDCSEWSSISEQVVQQQSFTRMDVFGPLTIELHFHLGVLSERLGQLGVPLERAWQQACDAKEHPGLLRLGDHELVTYACTHWAQHHFPLSIWLVDLALMTRDLPIDWVKLEVESRIDGTRFALAAALCIIDLLWASAIPVGAKQVLNGIHPVRLRLIRWLVWRQGTRHLSERATRDSLLLQILIQPNWRCARHAIVRGLFPSMSWLSHHHQLPLPRNFRERLALGLRHLHSLLALSRR